MCLRLHIGNKSTLRLTFSLERPSRQDLPSLLSTFSPLVELFYLYLDPVHVD